MNNCINFKNGCTGKSIKYNGYCFACCACGNMYCKNNIEFGHKLCKVHECVIFGCLNRNQKGLCKGKKDICLEHIICVITNEFGKFSDKATSLFTLELIQTLELADTKENLILISKLNFFDLPGYFYFSFSMPNNSFYIKDLIFYWKTLNP